MHYRSAALAIFAVAIIFGTNIHAETVQPSFRMEFQIQEKDLDSLMEIPVRYAQKEAFSIEDVGPNMPPKDNRPVFYVNLKRQDSAQFTFNNFLRRDQILLFFYKPKQVTQVEAIVSPLVEQLRERWSDIHAYVGP